MIKFFRKIRYNSMETGKTTKYFKYAIGEIILVVIGILIALQVNNANEGRKKQKEIDQLLVDIEQDLVYNYNQANVSLEFYRKQDSIAKLIADNRLTKQDYNNTPQLTYYTINWTYYLPTIKNLDLFVGNEKIVPKQLKPVIKSIKQLQGRHLELEDTWSNLDENISNNHNYFSNFIWLTKYDSISNIQRMEYMLKDKAYQIRALAYWSKTQNFADKISRYRAQTMATLAKIKRIRDNYSNQDLHNLFQKLKMKPFQAYSCNTSKANLKALKTLRSSELYGNLTSDTIYLTLTNNEGHEVDDMVLMPFEIGTQNNSQYFGVNGDNNTFVTVTDKNGKCINTFGAVHNGYLLIE